MADWGSGASGAISGAATGASVGGPIGGVVGGIAGALGGLFGGRKKKKKKSAFDKKQKQLNEYEHQAVLGEGPLADLYNYDAETANKVFDQNVANPAYRKFNEQLVPGITGQFRSQGLMNSSYVGDALSRLGRDVQENLNSQRSQYLYGEQKDARQAKRQAVDSLQNRNTVVYDKAAKQGGFDINQILGSITPEMIDQARNYFG